ncbi:MAG: hypothetical protein R6U84_01810 [Candidatus Cloacimonadales bacterium]
MEKLHIYLNIKPSFLPKAKYTFSTICQILGVEPIFFTEFTMQDIHLYYGERTKDKYPLKIYHDPETANFFTARKLYKSVDLNLVKYGNEYIPFLFSLSGEIVHYTAKNAFLRKDIIASAFYWLSCWQEYAAPKMVEPKHFYPHQESLQSQRGFTEIPVVDRYCEILQSILTRLFSEYNLQNLWNDQKFAVSLSHNIDYWQYWTENHLKSLQERKEKFFSHKNWQKWLRIFTHKFGLKYWRSSYVMQNILAKNRKQQRAADCFILTYDKFPDSRMNYFADEQLQAELLQSLKNCNLNLQGSKEAAYQYDYLQKELDKLSGLPVQGFRTRYLNCNYQKLFTNLERAKIAYDSSLGFYEAIGFRAGISYPFYPYNLAEDRPFRVLEIPVAVTDRALYRLAQGKAGRAKRKIAELLRTAALHQTHLSFVWHTHLFDKIDYPGWGNLYWQLNKIARKRNYQLFSLQQLRNFWQHRGVELKKK